ncbi:MAG: DUF4398 domain-containing protein [bacterium]|nr:DUF4398 domain-containing protein [bacterium]
MFIENTKSLSGKINRSLLPVVLLAAGLSACASVPQAPTDSMAAADAAIRQAEEARVADYASADLRSAREKIAAARTMSEKAGKEKDEKAMKKARSLADESRSDAELAIAKAQQARAESVNKELQRNNDTLQQELQRKSGN